MRCDICGSSNAVIHIQQIAGKEEININICEKCAREKGLSINNKELSMSLKNLLTNFEQIKKAVETRNNASVCSECGKTLDDLRKSGKAGCQGCYRDFNKYITGLFRNSAGVAKHRGKFPFKVNIMGRKMKEIGNLHLQLKRAVKKEDFEEAAYLRDRIRLMERQIEKYGR